MPLVATLVTHPSKPVLTRDLADSVATAIGASAVTILADGIACDLHFPDGGDAGAIETGLREVLARHPVDIAVHQPEGRRKRLLLADMDSTIIGQECIDELAGLLGLKDAVGAITARAMNGEIAFEPALRERVALLKGLPSSVIQDVLDQRITLNSGATALTETMRKHGSRCVLVSGGFTGFTGPVAERAGFDEHYGNTLLIEDGKLTGMVAEPILGKEAKRDTLLRLAQEMGIEPTDVIAVGDGANDLAMLQLAGMGVALHAKPAVAAAARFRIDHGDLTALLYLQGYRSAEFA